MLPQLTSIIGLTGGMGMGKSAVTKMLTSVYANIHHFDCDQEVASMYGWTDYPANFTVLDFFKENYPEFLEARTPGSAFQKVNRKLLREYVVTAPSFIGDLERLCGPILLRLINQWTQTVARNRAMGIDPRLLLLDAPLLFETTMNEKTGQESSLLKSLKAEGFEVISVVVSCTPELQRERCFLREGMTPEKFELLTSRQISDSKKRQMADYVIDTSGTLEDTKNQVDALMVTLKLRGLF